MGESPTSLVVTAMARICSVWASIPRCTLRYWRRRSAPCFLVFHSPSPKNLMPLESASRCKPWVLAL